MNFTPPSTRHSACAPVVWHSTCLRSVVSIEIDAQRNLVATLFRLALVALSATVGPGCGLRMAQPGAPAPIAARDNLRPAPEWVVNCLAQAAPDLHFYLSEHNLGARERNELPL